MEFLLLGLTLFMSGTASFIYNKNIFQGKVTPNVSAWLLWVGLQALNTSTYFVMSSDWFKTSNSLINTISPVVVCIVALYRGRFYGLNRWDVSAAIVGLCVGSLWFLNRDSAQANVLLQLAFAIGFIPMTRGVWKNPSVEKYAPWIFYTLGHVFSIAVIVLRWNGVYSELAYPLVLIALNFSVIVAKKISPNGPITPPIQHKLR